MPAWAFFVEGAVVFKLTFVTINLSFFLMCNIFLSLSFISFLSWAGLGVYILAISWNICGEG